MHNIKKGVLKNHDIKVYILQSQGYAINLSAETQAIKIKSCLEDLTNDKDKTS